MSPEDQKWFDDQRAMFLTEGWKEFMQEMADREAGMQLDSCHSAEDFWQAKGMLKAFRMVTGWENVVLNAEASHDESDI